MNFTSGGSHRFRCFTPADTSRVWNALTDGDQTRRYLHGLSVESSWCTGAPIRFLALPEVDARFLLVGTVLCGQPGHLLSYLLTSGQDDPATYLTWQLASCPGGSTVCLQVDRAECADDEEEAEHTWLPVLASMQALLAPDGSSRP
jgi:uncharacterized protein YndB with AHSA1/START domain